MNLYLRWLAVMIISPASLFGQTSQLPIEKLDSFVTKAMSDWNLVGLAIAIVKKDSVLLAKGYGYRDFKNKLPVNENTIFPIASCSKTFTTALIGIAEKEGKIQLNKPLQTYFPQLQLYTEQLAREVTAEDMLSHRTGSAGHDWAWTFNTNFPEEVYLKRIKYQEPFAPLRTQFQYSNFMYFVLSVVSGKLYNSTWNDLVREKLFQPLEMNHTFSSYSSRRTHDANAAMTYEFKDSFRLKTTNQMDDLLGAGSINSTAADLAKWLQAWINGGTFENKEIISKSFVKKSIESHFVVDNGINDQYPDEQFSNIGLCWFLSSYRGHYRAGHTGNLDGFSSSICFFPYDSLGIVVLANQNSSPLIHLVPDMIADLVFKLPGRDKNSMMIARRKKRESTQLKPARIYVDSISTKPLFSINKYTGRFENAGYGEIKIEDFSKALLLKYFDLNLLLIP